MHMLLRTFPCEWAPLESIVSLVCRMIRMYTAPFCCISMVLIVRSRSPLIFNLDIKLHYMKVYVNVQIKVSVLTVYSPFDDCHSV
ncbi:hypothetical protein BDZ94DRAFT_1256933 [Collybia nuda]|uniref:Uncharacterized protein n=1 Tax=Collybia nuda TaxID=64659 RepID=A0A9P5Y6P4_9AGAR|nr:hypothetical protein BDZ94DRAFT_1256933 [Collybia nuda]